jgi:hypothetical protein
MDFDNSKSRNYIASPSFRGEVFLKNTALICLLLSLAACTPGGEGERESEDGFSLDPGTQEYLDQAALCSMYFTYSGNKGSAQLSLLNVMWSVSLNEELSILNIEELKDVSKNEIDRIKGFFDEVEMSNSEASYYLIAENECLVHAAMGGFWSMINEEE